LFDDESDETYAEAAANGDDPKQKLVYLFFDAAQRAVLLLFPAIEVLDV
jgi:hypothetical protein